MSVEEICALESNQSMLEILKKKNGDLYSLPNQSSQKPPKFRLLVLKESIEQLDDAAFGDVDAIVTNYGLHQAETLEKGVSHFQTLLRPGGHLVFTTFHSESDLTQMLRSLEGHLQNTHCYETKLTVLQSFEEALKGLESRFKRYSKAKILETLQLKQYFKNKINLKYKLRMRK